MEINSMIFFGMVILFIFFIFMSFTTRRKVYNLFGIGVLVSTWIKFSADIGAFAVLFVILILWLIIDIFKEKGEY